MNTKLQPIHNSIRNKIVLTITATTSFLLVSVLAVIFYYDISQFRTSLISKVETLAEVIGENSVAALLFNDPKAASDTLKALRADTNINYAIIVTMERDLFAEYEYPKRKRAENILAQIPEITTLTDSFSIFNETPDFDSLTVYQPLRIDGETVGLLIVDSSLLELHHRLTRNITIFIALLLFIILFAYVVSSKIQKLITNPIISLLSTMRDVSQRKNYSIRVNKTSNDEVGDLIDGFNTMLEQIQNRDIELGHLVNDLRNAKTEIESTSLAKSQFLASMSHELRTPLNAILGYSELLCEDFEDEGRNDVADDLNKIINAGRHLLTLINEVLDFSKLDAGKMKLVCSDFSVAGLTKEVVDVISPLFTKNENEFKINISDDIGNMYADSMRLKQCLYNLLSNAAKFTTKGTITLTIENHIVENNKGLKFEVKDTGIGMDQEYINNLFEAFSQAEEGATRRFGGTGLGLAISQKICSLMGGNISVDSEPNQGSTFTMFLPAKVEVT